MANKATKCHVKGSLLTSFISKFGENAITKINVTFVGDLKDNPEDGLAIDATNFPDAKFRQFLHDFEMNNGDVKVITVADEDHDHVYVVQKLDILTMTELTKGTVNSIRTELKADEFSDMVKAEGAGYTLTEDSSKSMYKIDKLLER